MRIFFYTAFALVCFALNSILCRLALRAGEADAASFTAVRLTTGALVLLAIVFFAGKSEGKLKSGNWFSAFFLFAYAICFSFAYLDLTAATGALVLFGSVQLTMIGAALAKGERPRLPEWAGFATAFGGLVYLVFPGLAAPPAASSALMIAAGAAWGFYSLRGRASADPLAETAGNFLRAAPLGVLTAIPFLPQFHLSPQGFLYAALSGAVASGLGYAVWYAALRFHTATRAAVLQLMVPALAALGGVIFLAEELSLRILLASALILGGIALAIFGRNYVLGRAGSEKN
jgi:drug/metabolite transporter (DMT)-like permease